MRGISEEELKDMLREESRLDIKIALNYLIQQCKELNPWLPIDENTPKDIPLELFYPGGVSAERNVLIGYAFEHNGMPDNEKPTHYRLLPPVLKE